MIKIPSLLGTLLIALVQGTLPAMAQEFPKQPIKLIVTSNPGGGSDALARIAAEFLQKQLGQTVLVVNKPGASGAIGTEFVAKAPADGYTLLFAASEFGVLPAVRSDMPYKFDQFTYLMRFFTIQPLMLASPKLPVTTIPELVTYMKANPGKVKYGSTGVGAVVHLAMAKFEGAAGVKGLHVPYTGIAPVYVDMLAGNLDLTQGIVPFAQGVKVIGTTGSKRNAAYHDFPTLDEMGIKNASWDLWYGILAPPNLPKAIADRLTQALTAVMKDPDALARFATTASVGPDLLVGDSFKKYVLDDNKQWKAVAEREKIVLQQ